MKKATFDPSRLLYLYFRVKRAGTKTFVLLDGDGNPIDVGGIYTDYGFELFIKKYSGSRVKEISLTIGDGLNINGNELVFSVTSDDTNIDAGEYFWELYLNETEKTWLNGKAIFHNGEFDGVENDTESITITESGQAIEITISDALQDDTRTRITTSTATLTPDVSLYDMDVITAQAAALIIANPTGTPVNGNGFMIDVTDNGTARAITFGNKYVGYAIALPTTTIVSKGIKMVFQYSIVTDTYDLLNVINEL